MLPISRLERFAERGTRAEHRVDLTEIEHLADQLSARASSPVSKTLQNFVGDKGDRSAGLLRARFIAELTLQALVDQGGRI